MFGSVYIKVPNLGNLLAGYYTGRAYNLLADMCQILNGVHAYHGFPSMGSYRLYLTIQ